MKNKKVLISCSGIILLAAVNAFLFQIMLDRSLDLVSVYISSMPILPRTEITEEMITTITVPSAYLNENTVLNKDEIIGKWTDLQGLIPMGSMFYKSMLYDMKELPDMPSLMLKDGQAVYSMTTDLVKCAGNSLVPGQKIDIYCMVEIQRNHPIVDLLISNVRILSLKDRNGEDLESEKSRNVPYVITLALEKTQIPILTTALSVGEINLYASSSSYQNAEESCLNETSAVLEYITNGIR